MLSKLSRLGSIVLRSSSKFSNLSYSSPKFFSSSSLISKSSFNVARFSSNYSPLSSTINLNRFYSSGGSIGKEMEAFLNEEIKAEKASSKSVKSVPGFEVKADGAQIELTRKFKDENIRIRLNVNGSTTDEEMDENSAQSEPNQPPGPLLSKPNFSIEIIKPSGKTLCLSCNFSSDMNQFNEENQTGNSQTSQEDFFEIEALTVLAKSSDEMDDSIYMGDASLIDGQLYDILMDYLDERGIGKEFADNLIDFCTSYEHERYIKLLEDLKGFVA